MRSTHQNAALNVGKFVMALLVVAIHTRPADSLPPAFGPLFDSVSRFAVPFFFLCTGFLLGQRMEQPAGCARNLDMLKLRIKKLTGLYLFWTVLYLPPAVLHYRDMGLTFRAAAGMYLRWLFLVDEHCNSWMLWYLLSSIYGLCMIFLILKFTGSERLVWACGLVCMALSLWFDALIDGGVIPPGIPGQVYRLVDATILNGRLLRGFFYLPFGMLLAKRLPRPAAAAALLAAGLAGAWALRAVPMAGGLCFVAADLGLFALTAQLPLRDRPFFRALRTASSVVYFTHMYLWMFWYTVTGRGLTYGMPAFLWTTGLSLLAAALYLALRAAWGRRSARLKAA